MILGTLLPPLAVAARFGIGRDFWINIPLTIAGYIPGHVHNFYIQNIRNNKTHARTPKWAVRYGLVDDSKLRRNKKRSEWASRYNDRTTGNDYESQPLDEGQTPDRPRERQDGPANNSEALWRPEDEGYYGQQKNANASNPSVDSGSGGGSSRWHYPANFDGAEETMRSGSIRKGKKDRWARTEDAHRSGADDGSRKKKKKKSSSRRGTKDDASSYRSSVVEEPEDAVGGLYGSRAGDRQAEVEPSSASRNNENLNHEF